MRHKLWCHPTHCHGADVVAEQGLMVVEVISGARDPAISLSEVPDRLSLALKLMVLCSTNVMTSEVAAVAKGLRTVVKERVRL